MQANTLLVVGDVHITRKTLGRSQELLRQIAQAANEDQPSLGIMLLGDVQDTNNLLYAECVKVYYDFVTSVNVPIYHLVGNHEMGDSRTYLPTVHALSALKSTPGVTIIEKPTLITSGNVKIGMLPYTPPGSFERAVLELPETPHIVFAHQEFIGSDLAANHKSVSGDPIPTEYNVISGHIHGNQKLGNVWYPGTPCQHQFGDGEAKFFYLVELLENGEYKILKRYKADLPKFITLTTDVAGVPALEMPGEHIYRIVLEDQAAELIAYKRTEEFKSLAKQYKVKLKPIAMATKEKSEDPRHKTFEERLKEYAEQDGIGHAFELIFK